MRLFKSLVILCTTSFYASNVLAEQVSCPKSFKANNIIKAIKEEKSIHKNPVWLEFDVPNLHNPKVKEYAAEKQYMLGFIKEALETPSYPEYYKNELRKLEQQVQSLKDQGTRYNDMIEATVSFVVIMDLKYLEDKLSTEDRMHFYIKDFKGRLNNRLLTNKRLSKRLGHDQFFFPTHRGIGYRSFNQSFLNQLGFVWLSGKQAMVDRYLRLPSEAFVHDVLHFYGILFQVDGILQPQPLKLVPMPERKAFWFNIRNRQAELLDKIEELQDQQFKTQLEFAYFYLTHELNVVFPAEPTKKALQALAGGEPFTYEAGTFRATNISAEKVTAEIASKFQEKLIGDESIYKIVGEKNKLEDWEAAYQWMYENY